MLDTLHPVRCTNESPQECYADESDKGKVQLNGRRPKRLHISLQVSLSQQHLVLRPQFEHVVYKV